MSDVLIIGGGIFGLDAAVALSKAGNRVTIFEQNESILTGTSGSSLLRIHSGLHYPRDTATAKQSKDGEFIFRKKYSDCINYGFKNYYAIAKMNTRTTPEKFELFADKLSFPYRKCEDVFEFGDFVALDKLSSIYEVNEGVVDVGSLREMFSNEISKCGINLNNNHKVISIDRFNDQWAVEYEIRKKSNNDIHTDKYKTEFKYVIDATHGINREKFSVKPLKNKFEYQVTHMLNIETKMPIFGFTVLDGNFITVMPNGFNNSLLIYGPKQSVLCREVSHVFTDKWVDKDYLQSLVPLDAESNLLQLFSEWFIGELDVRVLNKVTGTRTIEANVTQSDRRLSFIETLGYGFFSITSTKIDHSPAITAELCKKINS
jgi:flavin-dependent dehydrogenase